MPNVRDGVSGTCAAIAAAPVSGHALETPPESARPVHGARNSTMSIGRSSSDAVSPLASENVSVTRAWTTVPEGSGSGESTTSVPEAVPPLGGSTAGWTSARLAAVAGRSASGTPPRASPAAGTTGATSPASGTTRAKAPAPGSEKDNSPAVGSRPASMSTQACSIGRYSARTAGAAGQPARLAAAAPAAAMRAARGPVRAAPSLVRRSNAASGDQPSGSRPGRPWGDSGVRRTPVAAARAPAGIVTASDAPGTAAFTVPTPGPTDTGAANAVSRASTGTAPVPTDTGSSRSTDVRSTASASTSAEADCTGRL